MDLDEGSFPSHFQSQSLLIVVGESLPRNLVVEVPSHQGWHSRCKSWLYANAQNLVAEIDVEQVVPHQRSDWKGP